MSSRLSSLSQQQVDDFLAVKTIPAAALRSISSRRQDNLMPSGSDQTSHTNNLREKASIDKVNLTHWFRDPTTDMSPASLSKSRSYVLKKRKDDSFAEMKSTRASYASAIDQLHYPPTLDRSNADKIPTNSSAVIPPLPKHPTETSMILSTVGRSNVGAQGQMSASDSQVNLSTVIPPVPALISGSMRLAAVPLQVSQQQVSAAQCRYATLTHRLPGELPLLEDPFWAPEDPFKVDHRGAVLLQRRAHRRAEPPPKITDLLAIGQDSHLPAHVPFAYHGHAHSTHPDGEHNKHGGGKGGVGGLQVDLNWVGEVHLDGDNGSHRAYCASPRLLDDGKQPLTKAETIEMFSSFSTDSIFHDPLNKLRAILEKPIPPERVASRGYIAPLASFLEVLVPAEVDQDSIKMRHPSLSHSPTSIPSSTNYRTDTATFGNTYGGSDSPASNHVFNFSNAGVFLTNDDDAESAPITDGSLLQPSDAMFVPFAALSAKYANNKLQSASALPIAESHIVRLRTPAELDIVRQQRLQSYSQRHSSNDAFLSVTGGARRVSDRIGSQAARVSPPPRSYGGNEMIEKHPSDREPQASSEAGEGFRPPSPFMPPRDPNVRLNMANIHSSSRLLTTGPRLGSRGVAGGSAGGVRFTGDGSNQSRPQTSTRIGGLPAMAGIYSSLTPVMTSPLTRSITGLTFSPQRAWPLC